MSVHCPVKVYQPRSRRYRPGCTANFSAGGALIELADEAAFQPGEPVELAVDILDHRPLHQADQLQRATVVRVAGPGQGARQIAVQFEHAGDQPAVQAA